MMIILIRLSILERGSRNHLYWNWLLEMLPTWGMRWLMATVETRIAMSNHHVWLILVLGNLNHWMLLLTHRIRIIEVVAQSWLTKSILLIEALSTGCRCRNCLRVGLPVPLKVAILTRTQGLKRLLMSVGRVARVILTLLVISLRVCISLLTLLLRWLELTGFRFFLGMVSWESVGSNDLNPLVLVKLLARVLVCEISQN